MSQPIPTQFFICIFREDQPGPQHKVLTSVAGLARFFETCRDEKLQGFDPGPLDVYVVDVESLEVARYNSAPLLALIHPARKEVPMAKSKNKPKSEKKKPKKQKPLQQTDSIPTA